MWSYHLSYSGANVDKAFAIIVHEILLSRFGDDWRVAAKKQASQGKHARIQYSLHLNYSQNSFRPRCHRRRRRLGVN
jgi:hypothetical protein